MVHSRGSYSKKKGSVRKNMQEICLVWIDCLPNSNYARNELGKTKIDGSNTNYKINVKSLSEYKI